jgi:RsiW-degrading membrane proteinase PrsW (M82 family)
MVRAVPSPLNTWQLLGVILASAILWMYYVRSKDQRAPEPRRHLVVAFVLGLVAWALSVGVFVALDALGVDDVKFGEVTWTAFYCFAIIGPLEEGTKVLLFCLFVVRWREFDEPMDGFVYAAAISLGFASLENFYNVPELHWPEQLARTAALPLTHMLFSAIWGFGIGYARFHLPPSFRRVCWQVGSVALAMFVHGLYDFLLFAFQATFVTSGMALILWTFVIWRTKTWAGQPVPAPANAAQGSSPITVQEER